MPDNKNAAAARDVRETTAENLPCMTWRTYLPPSPPVHPPETERHIESEDTATYLVDTIECLQKLAHRRGKKTLSNILDIARSEAENIYLDCAPADRPDQPLPMTGGMRG